MNKERQKTYQPVSKSPLRNPWVIVIGVIVLLVVILGILQLTGTTNFFHSTPSAKLKLPASGNNSSYSQKGVTDDGTHKDAGSHTSDTKSNVGGDTIAATPLATPTGDFVSSHNSTEHSLEASVCNTAPGATCKITFTHGGLTKALEAKITDGNGSAYWNWTPQDIGLTSGSWQITAIATSGNQTKTATDPMNLTVTP